MWIKNNIGLTLVELVIIASIIALVFSITIPSVVRARQEADESKIEAELRTAYTGISMYYLEKSKYPKTWNDLELYLPINKYKDKYELNPNL